MADRHDHEEILCREFVELVTDYWEGALPGERVDLVEQHLVMCDWCKTYLEQLEATIARCRVRSSRAGAAGNGAALLTAFREWRAESLIAYKFLRPGAVAPFSGHRWPAPADGEPGAWVVAASWTAVCRDGVHACQRRHLPLWIWEELWEVEIAGDVEEHEQKLRARRGRLVRRVEPWSPRGAKAFAQACAVRAAHHAAEPLRAAGHAGAAAVLEDGGDLQLVRELTAALWDELPASARVPMGMASDGALRALTATESSDHYVAAHGAAVSAYIAAMTALRVAGHDRYDDERVWQADWLGRELDLV